MRKNRAAWFLTHDVESTMKQLYLVVAGDDNNANSSHTTLLDGVNDFFARGIQHSHQTDKRTVRLQRIVN